MFIDQLSFTDRLIYRAGGGGGGRRDDESTVLIIYEIKYIIIYMIYIAIIYDTISIEP